jgi:hypothetical protein
MAVIALAVRKSVSEPGIQLDCWPCSFFGRNVFHFAAGSGTIAMSTSLAGPAADHPRRSSPGSRPQRLRASWEAVEILRVVGSDRIGDAELLMHATKEGLQPHPFVAADVFQELRATHAICLRHEESGSPPKEPSTVHARRHYLSAAGISRTIRRFEAAFLR